MTPGLPPPYQNALEYCILKIAYDKCKWWEFKKKKEIKHGMEWIYPLMWNELKSLTNLN